MTFSQSSKWYQYVFFYFQYIIAQKVLYKPSCIKTRLRIILFDNFMVYFLSIKKYDGFFNIHSFEKKCTDNLSMTPHLWCWICLNYNKLYTFLLTLLRYHCSFSDVKDIESSTKTTVHLVNKVWVYISRLSLQRHFVYRIV